MPSSHSALASALTVSVGIAEGLNSNLFVVTFFFALVVMRDAMGVRRSSGIQARALNLLGRTTQEKVGVEFHPVKEINGHTPLEVAVGGLLGVFIALAFAYL
jgi:acid phosphatase family membrane protein YuiD